MSSRPRRSAATRASDSISNSSTRSERPFSSRISTNRITTRGSSRASSAASSKMPSSKLRQVTSSRSEQVTVNRRDQFVGGEILDGKRNRGGKKSYVVESDSDDDDEIEMDEEDEDEDMEDADGEDEDAEGEDAEGEDAEGEDAEGEDDDEMEDVGSARPAPPAIKISKPKATPSPAKSKTVTRPSTRAIIDDDDDDDDLSDPESDLGNETYGDQTMMDEEDAEGEDDEEDEDDDAGADMTALAEDDAEGEDDDDAEGEPDSEEEISRMGTPDLSKMTRRQRARFEDEPQQYMKLSDEVQVKKVFTAEELSMRRAEMARRRRNLSEKRNEEVKMETINKLLKKQAPKGKGKNGAQGDDDGSDGDGQKPNPAFVRWINTREGSKIAVPQEQLGGPVGAVFGGPATAVGRKLIEEVS